MLYNHVNTVFQMIDYSKIVLTDLAMGHGFLTKSGVKRYCENTLDIAGDLLNQAGIDLEKYKGKILPLKIVVFLRKINPTWEDLQDEQLKAITLNQLFPDKFPIINPNTPQIPPKYPPNTPNSNPNADS